jgi:hypothetical protein
MDTLGTTPRNIDDPEVRSALRHLDRQLRARFGDDYLGLILFGSRARGDHAPDSDVDVAVVLRAPIRNRWRLKCQVIDDTYPILLDTGLYIQPWPVEQRELDAPDKSSNPPLLRNIINDGIAV